jgi:hypothetical protein
MTVTRRSAQSSMFDRLEQRNDRATWVIESRVESRPADRVGGDGDRHRGRVRGPGRRRRPDDDEHHHHRRDDDCRSDNGRDDDDVSSSAADDDNADGPDGYRLDHHRDGPRRDQHDVCDDHDADDVLDAAGFGQGGDERHDHGRGRGLGVGG